MKDYIITDKTVALMKRENETIFYNVDNSIVFHKNIMTILEYNCSYYGSNLQGRIKSAKNNLNIKYKAPIVIEDGQDLILIQINSLRNEQCLLLVVNKIIDYYQEEDKLKIICINNIEFTVSISKSKLDKEIANAIRLKNILSVRKSSNFL